jgi:hypothetical protein
MQDIDYKDEKVEYDLRSIDEQVIVDDEPASGLGVHHEESHFSWRATIVGSLLGCLIGNFSLLRQKLKIM